jgi:hypothetical protein
MHIKRHLPEWVFVCQRRADCPLIPVTWLSLSSEEARYMLQWDSLDDLESRQGESGSFLPSYSFSFSLLILTDGLLQGKVYFLLWIEKTLWLTSYSSTLLSEKMSQKGFTHPVSSNRWPFPCIFRKVQHPSTFLSNSKSGKLAHWPWFLVSRFNKMDIPCKKMKRAKFRQVYISHISQNFVPFLTLSRK